MKNKEELLSVASRINSCDVAGLMAEIIKWADDERDNKEVYNTLNTVAYTILEHCDFD